MQRSISVSDKRRAKSSRLWQRWVHRWCMHLLLQHGPLQWRSCSWAASGDNWTDCHFWCNFWYWHNLSRCRDYAHLQYWFRDAVLEVIVSKVVLEVTISETVLEAIISEAVSEVIISEDHLQHCFGDDHLQHCFGDDHLRHCFGDDRLQHCFGYGHLQHYFGDNHLQHCFRDGHLQYSFGDIEYNKHYRRRHFDVGK